MPPPPAAMTMWPRLTSAAATVHAAHRLRASARRRPCASRVRRLRPSSSPPILLQTPLRAPAEKKGPIGLDGCEERRVRGVHLDLGHDRRRPACGSPPRGSSLSKASSSRNPIEPCVCATQKSSVCGGTLPDGHLGLDQEVADLRAVAVHDDELVAPREDRKQLPDRVARPLRAAAAECPSPPAAAARCLRRRRPRAAGRRRRRECVMGRKREAGSGETRYRTRRPSLPSHVSRLTAHRSSRTSGIAMQRGPPRARESSCAARRIDVLLAPCAASSSSRPRSRSASSTTGSRRARARRPSRSLRS